jgi:hypothetical protein
MRGAADAFAPAGVTSQKSRSPDRVGHNSVEERRTLYSSGD